MRAQGQANEADAIAASVLAHQSGYAFELLSGDLVARVPNGWPVGKEGDQVPANLIQPLLMMVGCDFGANCDADSTQLLYACVISAISAICVDSVQELALKFPGLAPSETDSLPRYRALVSDAIRSNHLELLGMELPVGSVAPAK